MLSPNALRKVAALSWCSTLQLASEASNFARQALSPTHGPFIQSRFQSAATEPDPDLNPVASEKVIGIVDSIETLTVKEVVWMNKLLKERLGITDADLGIGMPMAPMAAQAAAPAEEAPAEEPVEEKKEFTVVIEGFDATAKIKIIKELRAAVPDLGLKEAKALVDNLPATVKENVAKESAEELRKKLVAVGAQVALK